MPVQSPHSLLSGTKRNSLFTAKTSGPDRLVGARQIVLTHVGHIEMHLGNVSVVSSGRLFLDGTQCSGEKRRRESFLLTTATFARMRGMSRRLFANAVLEQISRPCAPHHHFTRRQRNQQHYARG